MRDVIGGVSYYWRFQIERMWRDVNGEPIMSFNNPQAHKLFGAAALGVQLAPEISFEETGLESRPKGGVPERMPV